MFSTTQLNSDLNNRIEFTITSIDSKYAFTGNSYKHNGKVYINGYFHCNSPSVGITTCFFVPEGINRIIMEFKLNDIELVAAAFPSN